MKYVYYNRHLFKSKIVYLITTRVYLKIKIKRILISTILHNKKVLKIIYKILTTLIFNKIKKKFKKIIYKIIWYNLIKF
jgi:hypothetical protein